MNSRSFEIPFKLVRSRYLLPISDSIGRETRIEDGYMLYDHSGTILEVGEYDDSIGNRIRSEYGEMIEIIGSPKWNDEEIPCLDCAMLPGFVKAHCHDDEPLDNAVNIARLFMHDHYDEIDGEIGMSPYLISYLKTRLDDIFYGITTNLNHMCNHNKYHVVDYLVSNTMAGTSGFAAIGASDRHVPHEVFDTLEQAIDRLDQHTKDVEKHHKKNNSIVCAADQLFSNGPEILVGLKGWARDNGTLFHIHSSEEPKTTKWFTETYGMTPIEYADSIDILDEKTMVAHQVNNTQNDLEILARTHTKVVHNPLANTILGSGIPPVLEMRELGIDVSISTDGTGSSDCQNILSAARLASQYQKAFLKNARVLPAQTVLEMITTIPALSLGLPNKGSLEVGKDADFIMMDLNRLSLVPTVLENVVENLIWASNGSEVCYVVSMGKTLMDDYQIKTLDEDLIKGCLRHLFDMFVDFKQSVIPEAKTGAHKI